MKIIFRILLVCSILRLVEGLLPHQPEMSNGIFVLGGIFALLYFVVKSISALQKRIKEDAFERKFSALSQATVPEDVKAAIYVESIFVGALLDRLSSERYIHDKELPADVEIRTRRVLLKWLADLGVREDIEPWLNDFLLSPDGHWTSRQMDCVASIWEYSEILSWIMGLEALRILTDTPKLGTKNAISPINLKDSSKLHYRSASEIRAARDETEAFFIRCWSELAARGALEGASSEDVRKALKFRAINEKNCYEGDYRIGGYFVPAVGTPILGLHTASAARRYHALALLVDVFEGNEPPSSLRKFLQSYLSPEEKQHSVLVPQLSSSSI